MQLDDNIKLFIECDSCEDINYINEDYSSLVVALENKLYNIVIPTELLLMCESINNSLFNERLGSLSYQLDENFNVILSERITSVNIERGPFSTTVTRNGESKRFWGLNRDKEADYYGNTGIVADRKERLRDRLKKGLVLGSEKLGRGISKLYDKALNSKTAKQAQEFFMPSNEMSRQQRDNTWRNAVNTAVNVGNGVAGYFR